MVATLSLACQTLAATPDGSAIWVSYNVLTPPTFPATMAVIDPTTNTFTTFPLGHGTSAPGSIAFTPNGAFAFLTNFSIVAVIDTATQTEVAVVTAGSFPGYVAITPNGAYAYVANLSSNNVSVIDTATHAVVATVPVGSLPRALAVTPDGAFVYVSNNGGNSVSVIDTVTNTVTATFPLSSPWGIVIARAPNVAPVLASDNASVTVNEGQTAANTGTVTDANHDTVTLTASVGTVVNNGNGTWSWSFAASDGPTQSQTVTITGNDGHGGVGHTSFSLVVLNVPPTIVSVTNNGPVFTGNPATITVTATDPAGANDPLTYSFDCDNNGTFEIGPQAGNQAACTFSTAGSHTVNVRVDDDDGGVTTGSTVVTVLIPPPVCSSAVASPNLLSPPNHKFAPIQITGVTNGPVTITITSIFQDEKVGSGKDGCEGDDGGNDDKSFGAFILRKGEDDGGNHGDNHGGNGGDNPRVDGKGVGTATASVRAERSCSGNGRVYHISFTATGPGGTCSGAVTVGVARKKNVAPLDGGALYDSTVPAPNDHGGHND